MSTGLKRVEQRPVVAFWSGKDGQRPSPTVSTTKACLRVSRISLTSASVVTNSGTVPGEAIEKALYGDGSARFAAVCTRQKLADMLSAVGFPPHGDCSGRFGCVVCGIVLGDDRVVGYSFFAAGTTLAVIDTVRRSRGSGSSRPHAGA